MSKHTPTPWHVRCNPDDHEENYIYWKEGLKYRQVCENVRGKKDAEFIVRACNAHDDLISALQKVKSHCHNQMTDELMDIIDKALAKAVKS
jgi:hypothetical protein